MTTLQELQMKTAQAKHEWVAITRNVHVVWARHIALVKWSQADWDAAVSVEEFAFAAWKEAVEAKKGLLKLWAAFELWQEASELEQAAWSALVEASETATQETAEIFAKSEKPYTAWQEAEEALVTEVKRQEAAITLEE